MPPMMKRRGGLWYPTEPLETTPSAVGVVLESPG